MSYQLALRFWIFVLTASHFVLGKGGRGHSGDKDRGGLDIPVPDLGLPPLLAATFAFFVISATFTFFQAAKAIGNINRRSSEPSTALPEYSVGSIFSVSLLLSTFTLLTHDILSAIAIALLNNQKATPPTKRPKFTQSYFSAVTTMRYLTEVLLVLGVFAVLARREQVLTTTSPRIKIIFDAVLTAALFLLGMVITGLSATATPLEAVNNISLAYSVMLLAIGVNILVTSIVLSVRATDSPVNDHRITSNIVFIVSPAFILYAVSLIIIWNIRVTTISGSEKENLAITIIRTVTLFTIIATCLEFGMPPFPKNRKRPRGRYGI